MQSETRPAVQLLESELLPLRGLWLGTAPDLIRLGITRLHDLRAHSADVLAEAYCRMTGRPTDPVLIPYFAALIDFARTGVPTPWWRLMRAAALRDRQTSAILGDAERQ
jgi:hypothetical protein